MGLGALLGKIFGRGGGAPQPTPPTQEPPKEIFQTPPEALQTRAVPIVTPSEPPTTPTSPPPQAPPEAPPAPVQPQETPKEIFQTPPEALQTRAVPIVNPSEPPPTPTPPPAPVQPQETPKEIFQTPPEAFQTRAVPIVTPSEPPPTPAPPPPQAPPHAPPTPAEPPQEEADLSGATMSVSRVPKYPAWLEERIGGVPGRVLEFNSDRVTIGQLPDSNIQLDHSSVSPLHAVIMVSQGRFVLYDAGSTSGTSVNGNPVTGAFLKYGSQISMGASELVFEKTASGAEGARGAIVVRSGGSAGQSFPVGDEEIVIGRQPGEGGAQLNDRTVSHRHALVRPTAHGCLLFDLGSANGTMLDDVPLKGNVLYNGDVIKLGEAELQFVQKEST